jgi:Tol biopolymer transport system component
MDAGGGNQRRLLDFPVSSFEWSPDSHQLLFVSAYEDPAHDDPDIVKALKAPMSAVYLLDIETGAQKRVTGFGQNCSGSWFTCCNNKIRIFYCISNRACSTFKI